MQPPLPPTGTPPTSFAQSRQLNALFPGFGRIGDEELHGVECSACPGDGACGGQFTANTMATVAEAIGLAIPHSCSAPAPYESRDDLCRDAGVMVMDLLERNIRPRDICTREAFVNAARVDAASGGSTNAGLHLPAMAHECGIEFTLHDVAEIFRTTPYICDLQPGGKYVARDVYDVGGIPVLLKELLDNGLLHGDCMTVTGKTMAENLKDIAFRDDQDVIRRVKNAILPTGGVVGLAGSLAPEGAIVKVAGMKGLMFRGPARCFDCEEDAFSAVSARKGGEYVPAMAIPGKRARSPSATTTTPYEAVDSYHPWPRGWPTAVRRPRARTPRVAAGRRRAGWPPRPAPTRWRSTCSAGATRDRHRRLQGHTAAVAATRLRTQRSHP